MEDTTPQLLMRWIPVVDEDGRTRMEATWYPTDVVASAPAHAA